MGIESFFNTITKNKIISESLLINEKIDCDYLYIDFNSIISITSRVNLASEHMKHLELDFYKNLRGDDFKCCDRLVIQLESLSKINYKVFMTI